MSLPNNIMKIIDQSIETLVIRIIETFNLQCDKQDLINLWHNVAPIQNDELDLKQILTASKQELRVECQKRKLKISGTKSELIQRLTGKETPTKKKKTPPKKKKTPPKKKKTLIIDKIQTFQSQTIKIRKNKFGNYEHSDTKFVLDKDTQKVVGTQNDDGSIQPLTPSNIDLCNKYKFSYEISQLCDQKIASNDDEIKELDSDFSEDFFSE